MVSTTVKTEHAPEAIGPYSQGVIVESSRLVFTAMQIPLDPTTNHLVEGDIEVQTIRVIENIKAVLEAAGIGLDTVVKTTVFLKEMDDFSVMNRIYGKYFEENPPARSAVEVARLPKDALIGMECIAFMSS